MSDSEQSEREDDYGISTPIDDDYIDVEKRRAPLQTTDGEATEDDIDRSAASAQQHPDEHKQFDMSHTFDAESGAGASSQTEERIDQNAIIEHDGRAETRTFFYPSQAAPEKQHQFRRLIRWQEGEGDSERASKNRGADRRRTIGNFCGQLDMGPRQRERIEFVTDGLNMSHMAHYSSDKVILAIISLVANEDGWFIRDDPTFKNLVTAVGSDMKEVKQVRKLVRDKSERL